jgi:nicotinate-nucleotide adenylyltransferase
MSGRFKPSTFHYFRRFAARKTGVIGIYGGTFDPIHYGHLRTALEVCEALGLAEARLVPCKTPAHRPEPGADAQARLAMLKLALSDAEPRLCVDARELARPGPSYMIDTLLSLRAELGAERPLCLIVGQDAFHGLPGWRRWRALFEQAHIAVMRRPDAAPLRFAGELAAEVAQRSVDCPQALARSAAGGICFVDVTQLAISASAIRRLIRAGRSPRYLTPNPVLDWIQQQGLYR